MLARTSVFSGGWDLSAATRVVAADTVEDDLDVFDAMTGLADKSLVNVTAGETTRYGLLETIREYAAEKLAAYGDDANTALRASHLAYYLELAETAAPKLRTEEQKTWLDRLEADHDNFRAALVAASELTDEQSGLRLGIALRWYAWLRKRSADLVGPMADLVASSNGDPPLRADALVALAFILLDVYDFAGAAAAVDEAIQFFRSSSLDARLADALWVKSWIEIYGQDFTRVGALGQEGLVAAERAHDADTTARMHGVVALDAAIQGDLDAARTHFGLELQGYLDIGDRMAQGMCHNNFGESELVAGNLDPADTSLESAEAVARELHLPELLATVLLNRSNVADLRDDSACALARAAEALALVHRHNITRLSAGVLNASARALFGSSPLLSATVHGAIPNALAAGSMLGTLDARLHAENETRLRATLGTEELARCSATGHQLAMHDLLSLVREKSP
jgi:hypothetical protein